MKKILTILLVITTLIFASTTISDFNAVQHDGIVKISWKTSVENNIDKFVVEKSSDGIHYTEFTTERPKGDNSSYLVLDNDPFADKSKLYYRINIMDKDYSSQTTEPVVVEMSVLGMGATWGSIKAMFR